MRHPMRAALLLLLILPLTLTLSSCTLKATLDTTSDGLTNFLSSTTPGAWFTSEGLVKDQHKVTAFTTLNFQNLKEDMARGQGEYLTSLGTLIGVPADSQAALRWLREAAGRGHSEAQQILAASGNTGRRHAAPVHQ